MADKIREWLVQRYPADKRCESPIEALFLATWEFMSPHIAGVSHYRLTPQVSIGKYRADFCITVNAQDGKYPRLVVELDGHDFHEKTKEQAAHDKQRDRFMTGEGITLLRYAGSEVWANPFACVAEVASRCHVLRWGCTERQAAAKAALEDMRKFFEDDAA
jgi:very-short-patch-repair endonuclease